MTTIATLAERHGITLHALRFYESRGLLDPERKGAVRIYHAKDEARLALILEAKLLGFTIAEIPALIVGEKLVIQADVAARQLAIMRERLMETRGAVTRLQELAGERAAA